MKAEVIKL